MRAQSLPPRQWQEPPPTEAPAGLRAAVGGHALLAQRLARRGITEPAAARRFLSAAQYQPAAAAQLPDIDRAVQRLKRAIQRRERILIWGDFDVDGQTATALLFSALSGRGAQARYHVPNRFSEGHGIHLPTLKRLLAGGVDLLLTCDTGIAAHEAVDYATGQGVDVIISDHHALPEALPRAAAVVNPRRLPPGHALRELPGVGVAYKVIEALFAPDDCADLLDLVALGIVADVMLQVDDTRYLLQRGLTVLRQNRRLGIRAILQQAGIAAAALNEGDIGFAIAPRLNALGRLDDATPAVELLTTRDWAQAQLLAHRLESYNARRKFLSNQVYASALAQIEAEPWLLDYAALVLSHSDWHSGVIGIVAGRLAEEFGRPTVLLVAADGSARGSARSIAGWDVNAAFGQVAPLLQRYGGHKLAAGLSLPADTIYRFRRELSRALRAQNSAPPGLPPLALDGYLELPDITLALTKELERLAPFGNGNPPLMLATRNLTLARQTPLGRRGEHLQLTVEDAAGNQQRVIWWRGGGRELPQGSFDLAYILRASSFKGQTEALAEAQGFRQHKAAAPDIGASAPRYAYVDYRAALAPADTLARARQEAPSALVWAEGDSLPAAVNRLNLRECDTLIVWTAPPSAEIWEAALATAQPKRILLFGAVPPLERPSQFLTRLAALVKFAINQREGKASLAALAAALGARERSARAGLHVLQALGKLEFETQRDQARCRLVEKPPSDALPRRSKRLELLLRETSAYRAYWRQMPLRADAPQEL